MTENKVYLTFPTKKETADKITAIAHILGKTQPELLNEIIRDFIEDFENYIKEINERE